MKHLKSLSFLRKHVWLLCASFLMCFGPIWAQYTIESLPDPKSEGQSAYVSNPNQILSAVTVQKLNTICENIEKTSSAEVAIVVVNDYDGEDVATFSTELYNHWKIGKKGKSNGLLLFVAVDKMQYWITTGYGTEGILPDVILGRIGRDVMKPAFKEKDYEKGVINAMSEIEKTLIDPAHREELYDQGQEEYIPEVDLGSSLIILGIYTLMGLLLHSNIKKHVKPGVKTSRHFLSIGCIGLALFFILAIIFMLFMDELDSTAMMILTILLGSSLLLMQYYFGTVKIKESYSDKITMVEVMEKYYKSSWYAVIFSPLILILYNKLSRLKTKAAERRQAPDNSGLWSRVNRDDNNVNIAQLLTTSQMIEEAEGIRNHEIWIHQHSSQKHVASYPGDKINEYDTCPQCQGHTFKKAYVHELVAATENSEGSGVKRQHCINCQHTIDLETVIIPIIVASIINDSHDDTSYDSSSSDSSGDWGGGSSGGGGAGGSWDD